VVVTERADFLPPGKIEQPERSKGKARRNIYFSKRFISRRFYQNKAIITIILVE